MSTLLSLGTPVPVNASPNPSVISVKCLSLKTRNIISTLLNPPKIIPTESGLLRDWRGLAHLVGLKAEKIPVIDCDTDPTARVLTLWQKEENVPCNIKKLIECLEELDRHDIIDDASESIDEDMRTYIESPKIENGRSASPVNDSDRQILTVDDVKRLNQGLDTQKYDAFVVFADEDIDFATELIEKMEKEYGLKLCVRERDLIAGLHFEYKAMVELISERCNRLIVILSPAYLNSGANKFVVQYAQALGIEQGQRKIIPCLYERCEPPQELRHYFMLDYTRSESTKLWNFWEKLRESLRAAPPPRQRRVGVQEENVRVREVRKPPVSDLRPALVQPSANQVRSRREANLSVKFGSLHNLTNGDEEESRKTSSTNALYTSSSISQDITQENTTGAKKKSWLKSKMKKMKIKLSK